jgi:hypothetical protein
LKTLLERHHERCVQMGMKNGARENSCVLHNFYRLSDRLINSISFNHSCVCDGKKSCAEVECDELFSINSL